MRKHILFLITCGLLFTHALFAQMSINTTGAEADPSAGLDIDFSNKGLLIPRVALTSKNDVTTIPNPATGLLVYNTGTGGLSLAGYYYNAGTPASPNWIRFNSSDLTGSGTQNYVARWSSNTELGTGIIQDNNSRVSINTNPNDTFRLYVNGDNSTTAVRGIYATGKFGDLGTAYHGVYGQANNNIKGYLGGDNGAYGAYSSSIYGMLGNQSYGAYGKNGDHFGYLGSSNYGAYGQFSTTRYGYIGSSNYGVYGQYDDSIKGRIGDQNNGVYGQYSSTRYGMLGNISYGVYGQYSSSIYGYIGGGSYAVGGFNTVASGNPVAVYGSATGASTSKGVYGQGRKYGVHGYRYGTGSGEAAGVCGELYTTGVKGYLGYSADGNATKYAGYFIGNVHVEGALTKTSGSFLIDHPDDPLNKTLRHGFVESPENLCLYRGKIKLNNEGKATVEMPSYFKSLTKEEEATVTHTCISTTPFLTSYIWNTDYSAFTVFGEPNGEVSYQVLADRDDPPIKLLRKPVEEEKGNGNFTKGKLLYPEAYGYPETMGENYEDPDN